MVKIEGIEETIAALQNMGEINKKDIKAIVQVQANKMLNDARRGCQSDTVRRNINFITKNDAKYPTTVLIGITSGNNGGTDTITAPALASLIEYGSAPRYTKDGKYRGQIIARPFMRPAYDRNKGAAIENIKKGLISYIEEKAKKNNLI